MPCNPAAWLYAAMIRYQERRAAAVAALYLNQTLAQMDAHRLRDIGIDLESVPPPAPERRLSPGRPQLWP
jgi:uncharacterized protein YjiS (DUF1127 family)